MEHYHLTPSAGVFTLTREGSKKVLAEFDRKSAALAGSAKFMMGHESSLQIHREDGSVAEERAFPRNRFLSEEEDETRWEEAPMPGLAPYTFK